MSSWHQDKGMRENSLVLTHPTKFTVVSGGHREQVGSMMDPRIAAYVEEVSQPGIPYVSRSHGTLMHICALHGKQIIEDLLAEHWKQEREKRLSK
jgi:hypothetical protein